MSEREVTVTIAADLSRFTRALRAAADTAGGLGHRMRVAFWSAERGRKHRARCRFCNPRGNPRPLSIDGHAYRARARNRRKRR